MPSQAVPSRWGGTGSGTRGRALLTPEGLSLPLTIASRGSRAGALLIDLMIVFGSVAVLIGILIAVGVGVADLDMETAGPALELVVVLLILTLFLARFGYFLWFELGPRGATPGKRLLGIRIAARNGDRLTAEAVIARNLLRDAEVFVPIVFLVNGASEMGVAGAAAAIWLGIFVLFPFVNRDALRAGDLIAGTWVVEADRRKLPPALSASGTTDLPAAPVYRFGEAELAIYGEHELQVLEQVLRSGGPDLQRKVMEAICRKIGRPAADGDERAFLEAFYAALRERLERGMRFGRRKANKHA